MQISRLQILHTKLLTVDAEWYFLIRVVRGVTEGPIPSIPGNKIAISQFPAKTNVHSQLPEHYFRISQEIKHLDFNNSNTASIHVYINTYIPLYSHTYELANLEVTVIRRFLQELWPLTITLFYYFVL
jgi:hypothetical protein